MWSDDLEMSCLWQSERLICCFVKGTNGAPTWNLMGCYKTPYWEEKENFWKHLDIEVSNWKVPRLLLEDFNDMMTVGEKFRGKEMDWRRSFLGDFVQSVEAINLGFVGKRFTWEN